MIFYVQLSDHRPISSSDELRTDKALDNVLLS